jgi:hypothetical protein
MAEKASPSANAEFLTIADAYEDLAGHAEVFSRLAQSDELTRTACAS